MVQIALEIDFYGISTDMSDMGWCRKEVKEDESKEGPKELEVDAPTDKRAKVKEGMV